MDFPSIHSSMIFRGCPQWGQRYLNDNPSDWFHGILSHLYQVRSQLAGHFLLVASNWEAKHPPMNALAPTNDYCTIISNPQEEKTSQRFIGFKFLTTVEIRPSAICIKSHFVQNLNGTVSSINTLRAFTICGFKTNDDSEQPTILACFNFVTELREQTECIFYIHTTDYFRGIYIFQIGKSFDSEQKFSIEQVDLHGLLRGIGVQSALTHTI